MGGRDSTLDRYLSSGDQRIEEPSEREEMVSRVIKELGVGCARTIEEKVDLQFKSLEKLHRAIDTETFLKLVLANSLVSYQLTAKGEDWWEEFAEYFSRAGKRGDELNIVKEYERFLPESRTNRRLTSAKIKRLKKIAPFLEGLSLEDLRRFYFKDMSGLRDAVAISLGSKKDAKTVVFSIKMFGYAGRIAFGSFVPYPMDIPIPADSRIERYTATLTKDPPTVFWSRIARKTGVPPLHIDSILWPVLGGKREVLERLKEVCGPRRYQLVMNLIGGLIGKPF